MRAHVFESEQRVDRPLGEVFEFFSRAENLERITPPFLRFSLTGDPVNEVAEGTLISYRLRVHGVPIRWVSRIEEFEPGSVFVDRQLTGPYKLWVHRHEFSPDGDATIVRDRVRYQLPLCILGALANAVLVRRDIEQIFAYRRRAIDQIFG
jgi:uncharacterized protein